jgi:hypothetical protein
VYHVKFGAAHSCSLFLAAYGAHRWPLTSFERKSRIHQKHLLSVMNLKQHGDDKNAPAQVQHYHGLSQHNQMGTGQSPLAASRLHGHCPTDYIILLACVTAIIIISPGEMMQENPRWSSKSSQSTPKNQAGWSLPYQKIVQRM